MTEQKRLYVDFHVIQTVPPSCVNRDDTGSPKTALYGGVRRARVSSQSWKRAMREMFNEQFKENTGIRTKRLVELVQKEIQSIQPEVNDDEAVALAERIINLCGISTEKKGDDKGKTKALFFISKTQVHNLAEYIWLHQNEDDKDIKKAVKNMLNKDHSVDIALFGRMVADDQNLNADASAQVAHSISTHRVENEYDYFTALDDLSTKEDTAGADMIGIVEFNSATMYRYANVAVHTLQSELNEEKELTVQAVTAFAEAFIKSMPTGKQNTFANRTLPDAVMITIRHDQPINFVGAFEEPIRTTEGGYVKPSTQRLEKYAQQVYDTYLEAPEKAWQIGMGNLNESVNLKDVLQALHDSILEELKALD